VSISFQPFQVPINFQSLILGESFFFNQGFCYSKPKMQNTDSRKTKRQKKQCWQKLCERQVESGYVGKRAEVILGQRTAWAKSLSFKVWSTFHW